MITDEELDKTRIWFDLAIEAPILATKSDARVEMHTLGEMGQKLIAEVERLRAAVKQLEVDCQEWRKVFGAIDIGDVEQQIDDFSEIVRDVVGMHGMICTCPFNRHGEDCIVKRARIYAHEWRLLPEGDDDEGQAGA